MEKTAIDERLGMQDPQLPPDLTPSEAPQQSEEGSKVFTARSLIEPDKLAEVQPWYRQYKVKFALIGGITLLIAWSFATAFGAGGSSGETQAEVPDSHEQQVKLLQAKLSQMEAEKAIRAQGQVIPVKEEKPSKPAAKPKPPSKAYTQKPVVRRSRVPVARHPLPRRTPKRTYRPPQPKTIASIPRPLPPAPPPELPAAPVEELALVDNHGVDTLAFPSGQSLAQEQAAFLSALEVPSTSTIAASVGSKAKGKLITPIMWASDFSPDKQTIVIQLDEDLEDFRSGSIVFPKDTILEAKVTEASNRGGLVDLHVVNATINGQTQPIPSGAISVRAKNGQYLAAKKKGGSSRGPDTLGLITTAAISGLGSAADDLLSDQSSFIGDTASSVVSSLGGQLNPPSDSAQCIVLVSQVRHLGRNYRESRDLMRRLMVLFLTSALTLYALPCGPQSSADTVTTVVKVVRNAKQILARAVVRFDIAWGSDQEGITRRAFSGGGHPWKPINCTKKDKNTKSCGHIELGEGIGYQAAAQAGREWVSGNKQKVPGGFGPLMALFGGLEPANVEVWPNADTRIVIAEIDEAKGTARVNLAFRLCYWIFDVRVTCSPFVDLGVPNPLQPVVKEGELIIVPLEPPAAPKQVQEHLENEAKKVAPPPEPLLRVVCQEVQSSP